MKRSRAIEALSEMAKTFDVDGELTLAEEAAIYSLVPSLVGWTSDEWEAALNGVKMVRCTKAVQRINLAQREKGLT